MEVAVQLNFEWDPVKAGQNRRKHGVDFEQAATVFQDPTALSIYDEEHSQEEDRWISMGISRKGWLLVVSHTFQEVSPAEVAIRIISARRGEPV